MFLPQSSCSENAILPVKLTVSAHSRPSDFTPSEGLEILLSASRFPCRRQFEIARSGRPALDADDGAVVQNAGRNKAVVVPAKTWFRGEKALLEAAGGFSYRLTVSGKDRLVSWTPAGRQLMPSMRSFLCPGGTIQAAMQFLLG